jgi:pimeloyl-ACP methyl ester carboxylesterase
MRILSKFIRRVLVQGINSPTDSNSICFVHGLTGNRTTTWTSRSSHGNHQDPFWPNLLANEFPKARVLTYGYDVDVVRLFETTNGNGLRGHSESFLHDLSYARYHNQKRPLFLIAHSLGGLVVEEMLLRALEPDDDSIQAIATSTCGIMFFGTPHRGSDVAPLGKAAANLVNLFKQTNSRILGPLQPNSDVLRSVEERFQREMIHKSGRLRHIKILCFYEAKPTSPIGFIVSEDSATLLGFTKLPLDADHSGMAKFKFGTEDPGFKKVKGQLENWIQDVFGSGQNAQGSPDRKKDTDSDSSSSTDTPAPTTRTSYRIGTIHTVAGDVGDKKSARDMHITNNNYRQASDRAS